MSSGRAMGSPKSMADHEARSLPDCLHFEAGWASSLATSSPTAVISISRRLSAASGHRQAKEKTFHSRSKAESLKHKSSLLMHSKASEMRFRGEATTLYRKSTGSSSGRTKGSVAEAPSKVQPPKYCIFGRYLQSTKSTGTSRRFSALGPVPRSKIMCSHGEKALPSESTHKESRWHKESRSLFRAGKSWIRQMFFFSAEQPNKSGSCWGFRIVLQRGCGDKTSSVGSCIARRRRCSGGKALYSSTMLAKGTGEAPAREPHKPTASDATSASGNRASSPRCFLSVTAARQTNRHCSNS
eukprot:13858595-Heterocapsa_arctica.AAC.1